MGNRNILIVANISMIFIRSSGIFNFELQLDLGKKSQMFIIKEHSDKVAWIIKFK